MLSFRLVRNLGLTIILVITLGICIFAFYSLNTTSNTLLNIVENDFSVLDKIDNINNRFYAISRNFDSYMNSQRIQSSILTNPLNLLLGMTLSADIRKEVKRLQFVLLTYIQQDELDPAGSDTVNSRENTVMLINKLNDMLYGTETNLPEYIKIKYQALVTQIEKALFVYVNRDRTIPDDILSPSDEVKTILSGLKYFESIIKIIDKAINDVNDFRIVFSKYIEMEKSGNEEFEKYTVKTSADDILKIIYSDIININYLVKQHISESQNKIIYQVQAIKIVFIIAAIVSLILGISIAVYISRTLSAIVKKPINFLKDFWEGKHDLTRKLENTANDEIGDIIKSIITFFTNFRTIIMQMKDILKFHKETSASFRKVSDITSEESKKIKNTVHDNSELISTLSDQISKSADIINMIYNFIDKITLAVQDQASSIEESSSSINNITTLIRNISDVVDSEKKLTLKLKETAGSAFGKMQISIESIQKISKSAMDMLGMIEVINSISEQTDLLALNAAIEAAQAGDAGKGFTIVANELQKLSREVKSNVVQMAGNLKDIVKDMQQANELNNDAGNAFSTIVELIKIAANSMQEIMSSITELKSGSNEIQTAMSAIVHITESIKSGTGKIQSNLKLIKDNIEQVSDISDQTIQSTDNTVKAINLISNSINEMTSIGNKTEEYVMALSEELDDFITEKRTTQRYPFTRKLNIYPSIIQENNYKQDTGSGINISIGGILFYSSGDFHINFEYVIELNAKIQRKGRILRINIPDLKLKLNLDNSTNIYSVEFLTPLLSSELNQLIEDEK